MKAFNIEAEDSISIVDRFNEVGNNYAISSKGIGDALQRSAAALAQAGNSLDQSIGLIVGGNAVVQDPDVVGTALKTLTLRLTKTKTELEAVGEDGEYAAESISDLQDKVKAYSGVDIMNGDSYKSTYDILVEIAKVWDNINNQDQQALLYMFGGARQANVIASIIKNIDEVESAAQTASDSTGSALKENETYLDSIAGKMNQFQAQFQALSTTLVDSEIPKFFIDMGTGALSFFDSVNKTIGVLPTFIGLLSTIMSISGNGAGVLTPFYAKNGKIESGFTDLIKLLTGQLDSTTNKNGASVPVFFMGQDMQQAKKAISDYNTYVVQGTQSVSSFIDKNKDLSKELKTYIQNQNGATASSKGFIASAIKQRASTALLTVATSALNGVLMILASFAISKVVSAFSEWYVSSEEAIQKAEELQSAYDNATSEINGNIKTLSGLESEFNKLSQGVDDNGKNISLTASEYARYKEIVAEVVDMSPQLIKGYNDEGNAIVENNGLIEEAIRLQNELNDAKRQEYLAGGDDIYAGVSGGIKEAEKVLNGGILGGGLGFDFAKALGVVNPLKNTLEDTSDFQNLEDIGIDISDIFLGNVDAMRELANKEQDVLNLLRVENGLSEESLAIIQNKIDLMAVQFNKIDSANQQMSSWLSQWAAFGTGNQDWYGNISSAYLDEFNTAIAGITSDPSLDLNEMMAQVRSLGIAFSSIDDQLPTSELENLKQQFENGTISEEEYRKQTESLINVIRDFKDQCPEIADLLELIASGYEDVANNASNAGEVISEQASISPLDNFKNQLSEIDSLYDGYQSLVDAVDEYNQYGFMTAETMSALANSGMLQYLEASANGLGINTTALLQNAEAAKVAAINALQNSVSQQLTALASGQVASAAPGAASAIVAAGDAAAASSGQMMSAAGAAAALAANLQAQADAEAGEAVDPEKYKAQAEQLISNAVAVANSIANINIASSGYQGAMAGNAGATSKAKDANEEYIDSLKREKEALEDVKDELEDQKDLYDSVLRAVDKLLDDQIEALEKQKEALSDPDIKGSYGDRINQIQMQIDALENLRDAQEKVNAVEKARAEVERLKRQKTMRVYRDGQGFVWEADQTALEQAQADLEEAELDKQLADLEEAKEKLEDMLEQEEAAIDKNIEKLEEYKDQWGDIADAYEDEQDRLHAAQILGQNWEADILNGRLDTLNSFKDQYISIMDQIAAKVEEIEALERRISEAQRKMESASSSGGGGGGGGGGGSYNGGTSLPARYGVYDSNSGKLIRKSGTLAQAQIDKDTIQAMGIPVHIGTYAKGTLSAPGGIGIVDDQFSGKRGEELIIRPSRGRATMLEKGDGVLPARETMNLMSMAQNPVEFIKKALNSAMRSGMSLPSIQSLSKSYHFSFGEIVMQGVNDPNTFAQVLIREFPSAIKQELSK